MPFNSAIQRSDVAALIPEEVSAEIINNLPGANPLLTLARRLPNMSRAQRRMPVMGALATAYFVNGDTGLKQTTDIDWTNKYIDAEELAVIVPIAEAVLDDSNFDIWASVRPEIERALNRAITAAVLYGTNMPATWVTDMGGYAGIVAGANAASQVATVATFTDLYQAILGETAGFTPGLFMMVEADGYMVTGTLAHPVMKGKLRNVRSTTGEPIFKTSMQTSTQYELDGTPIYFPTDGSIDSSKSLLVSGQWDQLVYAMRQDITYKVLDQAVIQDQSGTIIYNLAQQDMIALRAVMRLGFALPNPPNGMNPNGATRYPFAVLK